MKKNEVNEVIEKVTTTENEQEVEAVSEAAIEAEPETTELVTTDYNEVISYLEPEEEDSKMGTALLIGGAAAGLAVLGLTGVAIYKGGKSIKEKVANIIEFFQKKKSGYTVVYVPTDKLEKAYNGEAVDLSEDLDYDELEQMFGSKEPETTEASTDETPKKEKK